jgi:hypothetical protein
VVRSPDLLHMAKIDVSRIGCAAHVCVRQKILCIRL